MSNHTVYRVLQGRALHWPTTSGKPQIWANAGQYVDLRNPYLHELADFSGQLHKLEIPKDGVPEDAHIIGIDDCPASVRVGYDRYMASGNAPEPKPVKRRKAVKKADLPSAAPAEPPPPPAPPAPAASEEG